MTLNNKSILIFTLFSFLLISCNGGEMTEKTSQFPGIKDIPAAKWERLSQKKIYFGHQSVGFNIMDGVKDLMKKNPKIKINIVETSNPTDFRGGGIFAHSTVGENTDPKSKMEDFEKLVKNGIGDEADIAYFKFCYIDIHPDTDVQKIFEEYKATISSLTKKYPRLTFIHVTVPLKKKQTGIKSWIKKIIGKPLSGVEDNITRNKYNNLLRNEYGTSKAFFDLAMIESTHQDGKRSSFDKNGTTVFSLSPQYTYDDGHLNEIGRSIVAYNLLLLLLNLS